MEIARQMPDGNRVAGFWMRGTNLGRSVKEDRKASAFLPHCWRSPQEGRRKPRRTSRTQNRAVLLGFRSAYVFDRLSRDLRPAWPATVLRRRVRMSCVRLDGSSHIIAQFAGSLQGGLDTDEFQFAGGDLSGRFVVSLCCV